MKLPLPPRPQLTAKPQSIRLEPSDAFGEYHCIKRFGPYTYEIRPTSWDGPRRKWTVFVTRAGGVTEQISPSDIAGSTCVQYFTDHYRSLQREV
jgi:hypothetical protein